jgi:hypothetical protein
MLSENRSRSKKQFIARRAFNALSSNRVRQEELAARLAKMTSNQKRVLIKMIAKAPPQEKQKFRMALKGAELAHNRAIALQKISMEPKKQEIAPLGISNNSS